MAANNRPRALGPNSMRLLIGLTFVLSALSWSSHGVRRIGAFLVILLPSFPVISSELSLGSPGQRAGAPCLGHPLELGLDRVDVLGRV